MTIHRNLYAPVTLETVDQVEALPIGTVATRFSTYETPEETYDFYEAAVKDDAEWIATPPLGYLYPKQLIGWTAFVPCDTARQNIENNHWLEQVKADAAREALERLADEMDHLDTSAIEAELSLIHI